MAQATKTTERAGYVYVLATAHQTQAGLPIVKIGMTTRIPEKRAAELSRGGPVGMTLEGFVTTRDAKSLERAAHRRFQTTRLAAGGGTEYFTAAPAEILSWLRTEAPRFELESARQSAWREYCASRAFKAHAQIGLIPLYLGGIGFWVGLFWHPHFWMFVLGFPIGFALGLLILGIFLRPHLKRLDAQRAILRGQLEEKYHLPAGAVRWAAPSSLAPL